MINNRIRESQSLLCDNCGLKQKINALTCKNELEYEQTHYIIAKIYWDSWKFRLKFKICYWYYTRKESPKDTVIDLENLSNFRALKDIEVNLYKVIIKLITIGKLEHKKD
jgi:hypothetical protein